MHEDFATLLDPHRANRPRGVLRVVLTDLAAALADELKTTFEITHWTVDPTEVDNGVEVRLGYSEVLGARSAGVVAFLHEHGRCAHGTAFLLAFDDEGRRLRGQEEFVARLTPEGWSVDGWGPDANYEWESYADDTRWRQEPVWDEGPANQYPETVARLAPQIAMVQAGLAQGVRPSEMAVELQRQGLGFLTMLIVGREASPLGLHQVKSLMVWWKNGKLQDAEGFDGEVARLLAEASACE